MAEGSLALVRFANAEGKEQALSPSLRVLGLQVGSATDERNSTLVHPEDADELRTLWISHPALGRGVSASELRQQLNLALRGTGSSVVEEGMEEQGGRGGGGTTTPRLMTFGKCYLRFQSHEDALTAYERIRKLEARLPPEVVSAAAAVAAQSIGGGRKKKRAAARAAARVMTEPVRVGWEARPPPPHQKD